MNCMKCKESIKMVKGKPYDHKCVFCEYCLCRRCDDTSAILKWEEFDGIDYYLCEDCIKSSKVKGVPTKSKP